MLKTWISSNGYEMHGKDKYVHRTLAEEALGRSLKKEECIHHIDYNRSNNLPSNLIICPSPKYHMLLHARQRIVDLGGNPNVDKHYSYHKCLHNRKEFSTRPSSYDGLHNTCREATNTYRKEKGLNKSEFTWKLRLNQQYRRVFNKQTNREICVL